MNFELRGIPRIIVIDYDISLVWKSLNVHILNLAHPTSRSALAVILAPVPAETCSDRGVPQRPNTPLLQSKLRLGIKPFLLS